MAFVYCIAFRIAYKVVAGKSYSERRQTLIDNASAEGIGYWDETSSFIVAGSRFSTTDFAERVSRGLSIADDMVVVFDPADMSASYFGTLQHVDVLRSFFPKLKMLK
jgi:hypothetical protein